MKTFLRSSFLKSESRRGMVWSALIVGVLLGGPILWRVRAQEASPTAPSVNPGTVVVPGPIPANSTPSSSPTVAYSTGIVDVVRLVDAGVSPDIVKAYIQNSPVAYHPTADEVIALKDHGVPAGIITALLLHGADLQSQKAGQIASTPVPLPVPSASNMVPYAPSAGYGSYPIAPEYATEAPVQYPDYLTYNNPSYYYSSYYYPYSYNPWWYYPSYSFFWPYYGYGYGYYPYGRYHYGYGHYGYGHYGYGYGHYGGYGHGSYVSHYNYGHGYYGSHASYGFRGAPAGGAFHGGGFAARGGGGMGGFHGGGFSGHGGGMGGGHGGGHR
jgi:uncharacterized membrane protein YgcG